MLDGMTNVKASEVLKELKMYSEDLPHYSPDEVAEALEMGSKALEQQTCEDAISREAVLGQISCWVNSGEYRYTNATYYLTRRIQSISPVTPQPFINKPCISEGVCHEDKMNVLDKIKAEIEHLTITEGGEDYIRKMAELCSLKFKVLQIIDKYKSESEDKEV